MFILDSFEDELFLPEKRMIVNQIKDMRGIGNVFRQSKNEIADYMKKEINETKVKRWWSRLAGEVQKKLQNEWLEFSEELDTRLRDDFNKLAMRERKLLSQVDDGIINTEDSILTDIGKGAVIAGLGGIGMAAYMAGLGPAAAYITFGTALSSIVPPLAIGGAIMLGAKRILTRDKELDELKNEAFDAIKHIKSEIRRKWLEKDVIPAIKNENKRICEELKQEFVRRMTTGLSEDQLNRLAYYLRNHIEEINREFVI